MTVTPSRLGRSARLAGALLLLLCSSSCRALLDLDDPPEGAASAAPTGADCDHAVAVSLTLGAAPISLKGSTTKGGTNQSAVGGACNGSTGPESVYAVTAAADGIVTARLSGAGTAFDSVLYAAATCMKGALDNAIDCADRTAPAGSSVGGGEVLSFPVSKGDKVFFAVDGASEADAGDYELVLSLMSGDACSSAIPIVIEPGSPMVLVGDSTKAADDDSCTGTNAGLDVVYAVTSAPDHSLKVTANPTGFDVALFVRSICDDPSATGDCQDPLGVGSAETTTVPATYINDHPTIYVWVDGAIVLPGDGPDGGPFTLTLTPLAP